ncbi:MAG: hypothetical protein QXP98_09775 [Thermoproteus sp.]
MDIDYDVFEITVKGGAKVVTIIPPPPSEAERWLGLGIAIARWGYGVQIMNLPTCRETTLKRVLARARGVPIYLKYSHVLAYIGPGALLEPEAPTDVEIMREASSNVRYLADWTRCLGLRGIGGPVEVLGRLPDALESLKVWLAKRLG